MPSVLHTAFAKRNTTPEFVETAFLANYLRTSTAKLKASNILADVPFRYNTNGKRLYRYTAAMDAIDKYHVNPPDSLHPLHEFTQAEAMLELRMKPDQFKKFLETGKLRWHLSERTGHKAIYRKDIERFYREWFPEYLVMRVTAPVPRAMAATLLGISFYQLKSRAKEGRISYEPRKRGDPYRYSKSEMLRYLHSIPRRWFRKKPLPDFIPSSLATVYMGVSNPQFDNLRMLGVVKLAKNPVGTGARKFCYRRSELDDAIDKIQARTYYCEGQSFYTRRAVKYKFLKSERWIDEFIVGKCRRVLDRDEIAPPTGATSKPPRGWVREDVERIVASGVEVKLAKKRKVSITVKRRASANSLSTPPVVFANPVDQMEAAIAASISAKKEESRSRKHAVLQKLDEESARLNAIRNILTSGPEHRQSRPSRRDMLRFAEERPIVTFLFSSSGMRGRYDEYPCSKEECIFRVTCGRIIGKRKIPPSFAQAISNALTIYNTQEARLVPAWVILVSATSTITDPTFHRALADVPPEIGAVAPFGYEYLLPDGSWDRCPVSYGTYGMYSEVTGERRRVDGIADTFGSHRVAVMDGPFVALRGEYLPDLRYIKFFRQLGDQRGLLGPVISGICRKFGIPMMQIPVESWSSVEYAVRPNTPEMNLAVERISYFVDRPLERLKGI